VGDSDIVYHLGDVTLGGITTMHEYIDKLRGNIRIVPGGHDYRWLADWKDTDRVKVLPPLVSLEFPELSPDGVHPQVIVLCHYALRVWDRSHYGAWMLYGHSHGQLPVWGHSIDVGVDSWSFAPVSLGEIVAKMKTLPDNVDLVKHEI
jgi:calcineurin-like phosphoesterase family protein